MLQADLHIHVLTVLTCTCTYALVMYISQCVCVYTVGSLRHHTSVIPIWNNCWQLKTVLISPMSRVKASNAATECFE